VVAPLLANIYLHYAFDLWVNVWREKWAHGEVVVVRLADDIILGFQHQAEADRFLENLQERLGMFGLELHPEKTRRIEFGRFAEENRRRRGEGKPETFDFLGFTHISGKNRLGRFTVRRKTIRKRMRAKLRDIKQQIRKRMHDPVRQTGPWLKSIVQGHFNYYAVPGNLDSLGVFRGSVNGAVVARPSPPQPETSDLLDAYARLGRPMVSSTASAPSLPRGPLCRQSSAIRTGCANEPPSGSVRGVSRTVISLPGSQTPHECKRPFSSATIFGFDSEVGTTTIGSFSRKVWIETFWAQFSHVQWYARAPRQRVGFTTATIVTGAVTFFLLFQVI